MERFVRSRWVRGAGTAVSVLSAILGVAGMPADLKTWARWMTVAQSSVPWWAFIMFAVVSLVLTWLPPVFVTPPSTTEREERPVSNPAGHVSHQNILVDSAGLSPRRELEFTLAVFNGLDEPVVFRPQDIEGSAMHVGTSIWLEPPVLRSELEVAPLETASLVLIQRLPADVSQRLQVQFRKQMDLPTSNLREAFEWSHVKIRFLHQGQWYRLRIPRLILLSYSLSVTMRWGG